MKEIPTPSRNHSQDVISHTRALQHEGDFRRESRPFQPNPAERQAAERLGKPPPRAIREGENATYTPSAKIGHEQQNWYERPYEEIVKTFQNYLQERAKEPDGSEYQPAEVINSWLTLAGHPRDRTGTDFYSQLQYAWDALAYDYYTPRSHYDFNAGEALYKLHRYAKIKAIKLSDPLQIRAIDALTESVGIPHQKGQAEIEIPEKLKDYYRWRYSEEYKERVAKAKADREARKSKPIPLQD